MISPIAAPRSAIWAASSAMKPSPMDPLRLSKTVMGGVSGICPAATVAAPYVPLKWLVMCTDRMLSVSGSAARSRYAAANWPNEGCEVVGIIFSAATLR